MRLLDRLRRPVRECGYGKTSGAFGNCTALESDGGVHRAGRWFCSEEHATLDQQEQLL